MNWEKELKGDSLSWLLEADSPGVRYLALRDLVELADGDPEMIAVKDRAHREGPIAEILANMNEEGYWVEPGPGYRPKYRSTVWAVILLAQLGAAVEQDDRLERACSYLVDHALVRGGLFSISGTPSTNVDCLQGNLCWALTEMKYEDARLESAFEWMAQSVTGIGVAPFEEKKASPRYYSGNIGPNFVCGANNKLPCAWGASKVTMAFGNWPEERRDDLIQAAIEQCLEFIFSVDPAEASYPTGYSANPSRNWWKFGFPVFYITDLLQIVEGLVKLGFGRDQRLGSAVELILAKQDDQGRWPLEYGYHGKTWLDFGEKGKPSKWVTLRVLRVLKGIFGDEQL